MEVKIIRNMDELTDTVSGRMVKVIRDGGIAVQDPEVLYYTRLMKRYYAAFHAAHKFGFVGVGKVTFAQHRMVQFQERLQRKQGA